MKNKKIAILQSNYIPWKGMFDMINQVDEFVFFDDVQFTRRDWRTRNQIKSVDGLLWLSIPVKYAKRGTVKINEVTIDLSSAWQITHYKSFVYNYKKAKYFNDYHFLLEEIYLKKQWTNLSEFNIYITKYIAEKILDIKTKFTLSADYNVEGFKSDKVLNLCKAANANVYLSGPSAKDYLKVEDFEKNNILVKWMDYSKYKEYDQLSPPFEHGVTILDVIFNCGPFVQDFIFRI